ncbi:hypothetical protein ACS0TY_014379 [Phlomoides rotata]
MIDADDQEIRPLPVPEQQWNENEQGAAMLPDLKPCIGFEPIEIEDEINPTRLIIDPRLPEPYHSKMEKFLKENLDMFTWSHKDKIGIDPKHACHKLNIDRTKTSTK